MKVFRSPSCTYHLGFEAKYGNLIDKSILITYFSTFHWSLYLGNFTFDNSFLCVHCQGRSSLLISTCELYNNKKRKCQCQQTCSMNPKIQFHSFQLTTLLMSLAYSSCQGSSSSFALWSFGRSSSWRSWSSEKDSLSKIGSRKNTGIVTENSSSTTQKTRTN